VPDWTSALVPLERLIDRIRHPQSRAAELASLRERMRALPPPEEATPEQRSAAEELRRLRERLSAALEGVESCSGCARGHPLPNGRWDGGHCCGGKTAEIFSDDEVAALYLGGTRPEHLIAPSSDHAGCAFRGATGCSLAPADRPTLCVRYICRELDRELADRGDRAGIRALRTELERLFGALSRNRALRDPRSETRTPMWGSGR